MKCEHCKKKKLFQLDCKCEKKFCMECLPFYVHNCSFDYKKKNKEQLEKINIVVSASKVCNI